MLLLACVKHPYEIARDSYTIQFFHCRNQQDLFISEQGIMIANNRIFIDLFSDWNAFVQKLMLLNGLDVSNLDKNNTCHAFFNFHKRIIEPRKRYVHYSDVFMCPDELQPNLINLVESINSGALLTPYLSRKIKNIDYNDPLLNDWGIYHLHLGINKVKDGFVERTTQLVYAMFDLDNCYLISLASHGHWTNHEFVEAVHRNWPDLISMYKLKGAIRLQNPTTETDRQSLRNGHINAMVQTRDGSVYYPMGMGVSASGLSTDVVMQCIRLKRTLDAWEVAVEKHIDLFISEMNNRGTTISFPIRCRLEIDSDTSIWYVIPIGYDYGFKMGSL